MYVTGEALQVPIQSRNVKILIIGAEIGVVFIIQY